MARDASIDLEFAGAIRRFRLGWAELIKLQEKCDMGPWVILDRLRMRERLYHLRRQVVEDLAGNQAFSIVEMAHDGETMPPPLPPLCGVAEISETIRMGLIGGGMISGDATKLVEDHVLAHPPGQSRALAFRVLYTGLEGSLDEPVGEPLAADLANLSTISPEEKSDTPPSWVPEQT
jgi:hypothetical protein